MVPHSYAPKGDSNELNSKNMSANRHNAESEGPLEAPPLTLEKEHLLFSKINLDGIKDWSDDLKCKTRKFFKEYAHIFALESLDMGHTSLVKHKIKLNNNTPFKERYRQISPNLFEEVKNHLKEMIQVGAIRCSNSPWASAVVLVRKKDGSLRFCIDLRRLNARMIKDAYSLPRIDETLDCLGGAIIFTSLDLKSGYWQVEMDEESKALTTFTVSPLGFYECERMPFGLMNAPATFQHLMESCLGELHLNWCIKYLDDIIVLSRIPEEHLKQLQGVLNKLAKAGLKLTPSKCEFFKSRITYLGHIVSAAGIEMDPKKIEAVKNWTVPRTVMDVHSFLGFTNHYCRFIQGYAKVASPLNVLISGDNANHKKALVKWSPECQSAFDRLKDLCTRTPILAYADYRKPFQLQTDASDLGLGAVLYQIDDSGHHRVIVYASHSLSNTERNYPGHKLEFLALKWAVTDRFHEYLYGGQFDVYTDNNPLTYVLTSAKLDATGQCWVALGKSNVEADALSHIPRTSDILIDAPSVKAIISVVPYTDHTDYNYNPSNIVCKLTQIVVHKCLEMTGKLNKKMIPS